MDIKERIDGLTEAEAKAALEWCVMNWTRNVSCVDCRLQEICVVAIKEKSCAEIVLEAALKEAPCIQWGIFTILLTVITQTI